MSAIELALRPEVFPAFVRTGRQSVPETTPSLRPEHTAYMHIYEIFQNYQLLQERINEPATADNIADRVAIYNAAFDELQSFQRYRTIDSHVQWYTTTILIDTMRTAAEGTIEFRRKMKPYANIQTSKRLLTLKDIGPVATEAILENLSTQAYKWMDISPKRRKRYFQKTLNFYGTFVPKTYTYGDTSVTVKEFEPFNKDRSFLKSVNEDGYLGITPLLADIDRDAYLTITSQITPATIAQMIGNIDTDTLLSSPTYSYLAEKAATLLPAMANPFQRYAPNKTQAYEWFKTQTQKPEEERIPIHQIPFFQILFARPIPMKPYSVYEIGKPPADPYSSEYW